jgi:murein DD-endopeptidase MepM/ murein hydrolase activator NlpD
MAGPPGDSRNPTATTSQRGPAWAIVAARLRIPLTVAGALLFLVAVLADLPVRWALVAVALVVVGFALYLRVGTVHAAPTRLRSPVGGRWVPVNSPADKVPSHGVQAYAQTYAVDLVHVPDGDWSLDFGWAGPHTRPPEDYPGFGRPVLACADGVVVRARGNRRDHGARTSYLGLVLLLLEGFVLEVTGRILGNHVVVDIGEDAYVLVAHLRRGSLRVGPGDRVRAGDVLGECGNSGNTSEPHVHVQVMDRSRASIAAGLPLEFTDTVADDGSPVAVPRNGQPFCAPEPS